MYHIIVNLHSGKNKGKKALDIVEKMLTDAGKKYAVHPTEYAGHATEIAQELSMFPDTQILMMGGDGSFNEILNGIDNFENVTLGIIPCGTGNDFVRASGHPRDIKKAVERILKGNVGYIDFMQLDDRRCLNVLGAGMDVDVLLNYAERKSGGKMKYYAALLDTLAHTRFHKLRLSVDGGEPVDKSVFMIGIGNGRCIGGGMPICPNAVVDDGKLDVVVVNEIKKSKIPFYLPSFLSGGHVKKYFAEETRGKEIVIEVLDDSKFEADGEIFEAKKINCHIVENTLKVFR